MSISIIAKVTHNCNLGCAYCYVNSAAEQGVMDEYTLGTMLGKVSKLNEESGRTRIIWHGGEPLIAGKEFYRRAVGEQSRLSHTFINGIQTNGTLLNEEFLDFFEEHKFGIGFSLDGTQETHDKNRPYRNGKSSFTPTFDAIKRAQERHINNGVICVLNQNTYRRIEEIYQFLKDNRISFKVNPQIPCGRALETDLALSSRELSATLTRLFDRWFYDDTTTPIDIDPFTDLIGNIGKSRNSEPPENYPGNCVFRNNCANSFLAVVPNGNVYPCGRFVGETEYLLGNINEDSIEDILDSPVRKQLLKRASQLPKTCTACDYSRICKSGCPDNARSMNGDIFARDGFCSAYKTLFRHIEKTIKKELEAYHART
ncbi:SPASM domain-containing protein [Candidatus Woesearchaeota archaeon]|nr:SPASM domain-containing protein [Candidatus Woesearchaeota archaeon]